MRRIIAGLLIAPALMLLTIAGALAHARFDHATPSPGQVLQTAPTQISIYTAEDMRKTPGANEIRVIGPNGARVDNDNTVIDDANRKHFSVGLQPNLPNGRYVVSFKTLSDDDGDADHGSYAFYVGVQPTPQQKAQDQQLKLTTETADAPTASSGTSHTGLWIAVGIVAAVVVVILGGGIAMFRRRPTPPAA